MSGPAINLIRLLSYKFKPIRTEVSNWKISGLACCKSEALTNLLNQT
ncbi:MAG: Uncharacterised protein [Cryomorphaceae bacterium]|nr:MAG: Uncharacterised protein [Cryomorphaceae bacterium]